MKAGVFIHRNETLSKMILILGCVKGLPVQGALHCEVRGAVPLQQTCTLRERAKAREKDTGENRQNETE